MQVPARYVRVCGAAPGRQKGSRKKAIVMMLEKKDEGSHEAVAFSLKNARTAVLALLFALQDSGDEVAGEALKTIFGVRRPPKIPLSDN